MRTGDADDGLGSWKSFMVGFPESGDAGQQFTSGELLCGESGICDDVEWHVDKFGLRGMPLPLM